MAKKKLIIEQIQKEFKDKLEQQIILDKLLLAKQINQNSFKVVSRKTTEHSA